MNDQLKLLSSLTGWRDDTLSRLAIFRSLKDPSTPPLVEEGKAGGKDLRAETLFREHEEQASGLSRFWMLPFVAALAVQHSGQTPESEEAAYKLLVAHWARGLTLLQSDFEAAGRSVGVFLQKLARDSAPAAMASAQGGLPRTAASVCHADRF
jgi:DNA sulfur modification protein DndE